MRLSDASGTRISLVHYFKSDVVKEAVKRGWDLGSIDPKYTSKKSK